MPQAVSDSFNVMIPMLLTLSIFGIVSAVLAAAFSTDLMTIISTFISEPLKGIMNAGPWAVVLIYTLANLLFCLGIHQSTISGVLAESILTILIVDNMATFASGQPIPADHYMKMLIINSFALIGGSGCTLMLLLDTLVFSKSKTSRTVAKMAIVPGLFNINEPVIYGYPIVYNLPACRVLVWSPLPCREEIDGAAAKPGVVRTNALLREIFARAQERIVDGRVAFADAYPALLDAAGSPLASLYRPGDGLHINDAGYDRVTAVLEPKLRALLAAAD